MNFIAWLLNNRSWKSRLFRQFFFHVWHIFSSLKFLQILPQSSIQPCFYLHKTKQLLQVILHNSTTWREALLIGQFEFAANSAAQLSLDENEGDSWICEEQALNWLSTSKKEFFSWNGSHSWKFFKNLPGNLNEWIDKIDFLKIVFQWLLLTVDFLPWVSHIFLFFIKILDYIVFIKLSIPSDTRITFHQWNNGS